ncbi:hypothetical protein MCOR27_000686 [Pyricularia oryzae]|nr:hypothetical protein MCOR01_003346 [Pyricularia oryzae]KAI6260161.1 hypothetical protein MCOR19_003574 [Pyricularia oryzae]KAI6288868.1 hypothetical protein MCOR27_000686 [Pyricularia oryzae]KAI6326155.1 hypothetical protein MCOR34_000928 [Pyricularia oryzae]KAI6329948.1 hypothetical protein MCOR30_005334 [Pyricularia oryzae]
MTTLTGLVAKGCSYFPPPRLVSSGSPSASAVAHDVAAAIEGAIIWGRSSGRADLILSSPGEAAAVMIDSQVRLLALVMVRTGFYFPHVVARNDVNLVSVEKIASGI